MHLRTCLVPMPPFMFPTSNPDSPFVGPLITMYENIAARANFTYELRVAPDKCTVSMRYPNGSWTGCRGMMQRNETDLLLGLELLTAEDLEDIRIGSHYYVIAFQFMASAGYVEEIDFSKLFLAFDVELWYTLLVGIILLSGIVSFLEKMDVKLLRKSKPEPSSGHVESNFWMFMATLFLEGTPRVPPINKTRLIFGTWILMVLILMSAFSSQLKTALMLKGQDDTMHNLYDLAARPEVIVYTRKSGVLEESLKNSAMEVFQLIWRNVLKQNRYGMKANDYFFKREMYDIIKSGKGVLMGASSINKWVVAHLCPTMVGKRWFYFIPGSQFTNILRIYAPPSFPTPLFDRMNKLVLYLSESAIFDKWIEDANVDYYRKCLTSDSVGKENTETSSLSFEHLLPIVFITLSLQLFAFCVLLAEIVYFKVSNRNRLGRRRNKAINSKRDEAGKDIIIKD